MTEPSAPLDVPGTDRYVLTIDLQDDPAAIEAYRRHHREVWPEVIRSLHDAGVRQMDLHLLGRRLVMIIELEHGLDLHTVFTRHGSSSSRVAEWQRLMASFQQPAPGALTGEWWARMEQIYHFAGPAPVRPCVRKPPVPRRRTRVRAARLTRG